MNVCFYFQVHQPFRLRHYQVFDIGQRNDYFDDAKNAEVMRKVANKCYLPTTTLLLALLKEHKEFKCAFSITGTALEQFALSAPDVIENFRKLAKTGRVEFLAETSHHSLSFLFDRKEFAEQVKLHTKLMKHLFGQTPKVFRNTELIYSDEVAAEAAKLGYKAVLMEGADHVLGWRSPNFVYEKQGVKLLLKNYKLSDDIAFRFSDKHWNEHPLSASKFASWVDATGGTPAERAASTVNLFMDFETFGEHQWA
ncbi:polysaccharide deacetylase family protein, partial [Candidatus Woesearchaeota archaeon]|nr:polysaccharide deacetylase family protein [Candidatus Woesearchaeota archaeon]